MFFEKSCCGALRVGGVIARVSFWFLFVVELLEFCDEEMVTPATTISGTKTNAGNDEPTTIRDDLLTGILLEFFSISLIMLAACDVSASGAAPVQAYLIQP